MSGAQQAPPIVTAPRSRRERDEPTGWVGWVFFASIMMMLLGSIQVIMGLVALFEDEYYLVTQEGLVVSIDYTTWGWVHLVLGGVIALAGFGTMIGQMWARVIGIVLAAVSALANIMFLAAYPVWSIMIIAFDIIVIYALAVHGREVKNLNG